MEVKFRIAESIEDGKKYYQPQLYKKIPKTFFRKEQKLIDIVGQIYWYDTFEEAKKVIDRFRNPKPYKTIIHEID